MDILLWVWHAEECGIEVIRVLPIVSRKVS